MKRHKHDIITLLALVGFGVSLYLSITHYLGFTVPCDITHGCEVVLTSKYSMFLGLPVAVWGAVYFTAVIITSLLANHYLVWRRLLTVLLSVGLVVALGLMSIQFFVLKKVCQYCLTTDTISLILFFLDLNIDYIRS